MSFANYLKEGIVKRLLKIEDARVKMFGKIDYIMFPAAGMAEFINQIGKDLGEDYLFNLGYEAGTDGANEMIEKLGLFANSIPTNLNIILAMFETLGFGKMNIKVMHSEQGQILLTLIGHPVVEYAKLKCGNKSRVCSLYRGIFSIHAEKELKVKNCKLIETQCILKGDAFCEWSSNYLRKAVEKKR